jgi:type I restriction enzyme S subunit
VGCDEQRMPLLERGETIRSSKYLVDGENILLSKLNPRIPRVWLPFPDTNHCAIASSEFLVLLPKKPLTRPFLYSLCQSLEFLGSFAALTLGTSTSHQRVKPQDFMDMDTILPTQSLIDAFSNAVDPMLRVIHAMRLKNVTLRSTRDLLLPRLISGEVDVSGLDITANQQDETTCRNENKDESNAAHHAACPQSHQNTGRASGRPMSSCPGTT